MTPQELLLLTQLIGNETKVWVALIGLGGVVVGAFISGLFNYRIERSKTSIQRSSDKHRQKLLKQMLSKDNTWRSIGVLSRVIGCSEEQTRNHLILIGARASEGDKEVWALLTRQPLP